MTSKTVRIRLKPRWNVDPSERVTEQMTFDVRVESETMMPLDSAPVFGVIGPLAGDECRPVVLRRDGVVDYGAACPDDDRFDRCNLLWRKAQVGELVTYTDQGGLEYVYEVAAVD